MSDTILDFRDTRDLANDIQFCEALNQLERERQRIYFDTAGVVDMLLGWDALMDVDARFIKLPFFNRKPMLICALAYKKWLGPIHLLSPHTEELNNKLLRDKRRFPEKPWEDTETLTNEFWNQINLKIKETGLNKEDYLAALQKDAANIFKGVFLGNHGGFWKSRYKYILKDAQILHLANSADYDYGDITSHRLFQPLLRFLNEQRSKQANNYLDAIALCLLDEKLRQFDFSNTSTALPIFFSNQDAILKAVRTFSQQRDSDGRAPFTYQTPSGKSFLVVRNSNFFIISGIYQGIKENGLPDLLDKYNQYLNSLRGRYDEIVIGENHDEESLNALPTLRSYVVPSSDENVMLNFFQEWLRMEGYQELNFILSDQLGHKTVDQKEVDQFIRRERSRQRQQLKGFGDRIGIVRSIWHDFGTLKTFIKRKFPYGDYELDMYKEIGPRLYYSEAICHKVQEHIKHLFHASENQEDSERDLVDVITEVVNDLASSLFGGNQRVLSPERLERLACGLAVLWVFEKYERIGQICDTVYERYKEANPADESDKYPSPSIALIHAAAILSGRLPRQDHVLSIIKCVMNKFGEKNYNVWLGLSYIHTSIWRYSGGGFSCPEWHFYRTNEIDFEPPYKNHLQESLRLSRQAYEWLRNDEKNNKNLGLDKKRERQAKLFYGLNNYLFMLAICSKAEEFRDSLHLAEIFQNGVTIGEVWHSGRYADTLACYYLRMAMLSRTTSEFERNIKRAKQQSEASMSVNIRPVDAYEQINMRIHEVEEKGFDLIRKKMTEYEQAMAGTG